MVYVYATGGLKEGAALTLVIEADEVQKRQLSYTRSRHRCRKERKSRSREVKLSKRGGSWGESNSQH